MRVQDVPQDNVPTFKGFGRKALCAVDENGGYRLVPSTGWEVEETALRDALREFEELAADAERRVREGKTSPIEYFMYKNLMDLPALSMGIGIAKWRIRRHMRPHVFRRLPDKIVDRYASFFRTTSSGLRMMGSA